MQVYNRDNLLADIEFDPGSKKITAYRTYTDDILKLPFGSCTAPDYSWVEAFLEERCVPRARYNIKELLNMWGLDKYDPLAIVKITHGLMLSDYYWVRFDREDITYDQIKVRAD